MSDASFRGVSAAVTTPPGSGGIATIELLGQNLLAVASALGAECPDDPGALVVATLRDRAGEVLDDAVLRWRREGNSERLWVHLHGASVVVARVLAELESRGTEVQASDALAVSAARARGEGERAARCRALLPRANGIAGFRVVLEQAEGALERWEEQLSRGSASGSANGEVAAACDVLLARERLGRACLRAPRVAFRGVTNAGKSSLANALAGRECVLVSEEAGTTRDVLTVPIQVAGFGVDLLDMPGEGEPLSLPEQEGQRLARQALAGVDAVIAVVDGRSLAAFSVEERAQFQPAGDVLVTTFADQPDFVPLMGDRAVCVSSLSGAGIETLRDALAHVLGLTPVAGPVPLDSTDIGYLRQLRGSAR